jgi:hypothetical protein
MFEQRHLLVEDNRRQGELQQEGKFVAKLVPKNLV